jgi:hypothetical protein
MGDNQQDSIEKQRLRGRFAMYDRTVSLAQTIAKMVALVMCVRYMYLSLGVLAGRETKFEAVMRTLLSVTSDRWVAYAVSAIFGVSWYRQRRLSQKSIKEREAYIRDLEKRIDPRRSSSGLSATGRPKKKRGRDV